MLLCEFGLLRRLSADEPATGLAVNYSVATKCAEVDNINVGLFTKSGARFRITATHPSYKFDRDNCQADFSHCPASLTDGPPPKPDTFKKLFDDGRHVVELAAMDRWWRGRAMTVEVNGKSAVGHYVRLYRKVKGEASYPQTFVLYQDGNIRLKCQPKGANDQCFGSSVIVGPTAPSERPAVDVKRVEIAPKGDVVTITLSYANGESASMLHTADRTHSTLEVTPGFKTDPDTCAVVFRSMYVADGNSDVDHVRSGDADHPIMKWKRSEGTEWRFYRKTKSKHNTSAPDISIELRD